ncbi:hypothetical protein GPECTOR_27g682 [Gonium pectorale]|uniref:ABC transporter domain-containing protein n=1 Tax=Gonium pectorale TaxID=33097 RepID=A0A150GF79_GONPE|nr:hypothetical protein GPECTOR_27g682 [Gonium pectorale]|eukprot:KXZ48511.1 hypothetical protein GPECTOR_27g682 [Gonium pectorale]
MKKAVQCAGVDGKLLSGNLNVIMGPSGCGKTTLINILSGRMPPADHVQVLDELSDGQAELTSLSSSRCRRRMGYVPQEDVLHANLTVRENLDYAACLRMPPGTPGSWRSAVVYAIMKDLELYPRQDQVVGSEQAPAISGGQRKRVNIGMGMVALPPILFMDEPTSGLDGRMSLEVIRLVRRLAQVARMNMTAVIHQPSAEAFLEFDYVLLLTTDKRVAYHGPPAGCHVYFGPRGLGFNW